MQRQIIIGLALTLLIAVFVPVYWAAEPGRQARATERLLHESVEHGAHVYADQCAQCHGAGGEGLVGPALRDTPLDAETFAKLVSRGLPGTTMPAFHVDEGGPLKDTDIAGLTDLAMNWGLAPEELEGAEADTHAAPAATTTTTAPEAIDPAQTTENYASYCAVCHGPSRQGVTGLAPALTPDELADGDADQLAEAIANGLPGTAMPSFSRLMMDSEIVAMVHFLTEVNP